MKKEIRWFGVKTVYLSKATGKALNKDKFYKKATVYLEERIVLFKAKNFAAAIKMAEREAIKYSKYSHVNTYGEIVKCKYTGCCDAYHMYDPPASGLEVFSMTEVHLSLKHGKKAACDKIGLDHGKLDRPLRIRFSHR